MPVLVRCGAGGRWLPILPILALLSLSRAAAQPVLPPPAQEPAVPAPHLLLPPVWGANVLASQIHAEANYIAAQGDFLVSAGVARRENALAREQEIHNALLWVKTYFEARAINRAEWKKEHPPFLDREELRQQQTRRRIVDDHAYALQSDPTDDMNWLLERFSAVWMDYRYLPRQEALADSPVDLRLTPEDIHHLRFTDGRPTTKRQLVFRADEAQPLQTAWPEALQGDEFTALRCDFERIRDQVLQESRTKQGIDPISKKQLMQAVDALCAKFNEVYPPERRTASGDTYATYAAGKRFVRTLAGGVYRLFESNDRRSFDGSFRFQGDSAVDLVDHLFNTGLQFAPPEPGDEGTYRKLFFGLRSLYTQVEKTQPGLPVRPQNPE